MSIKTITSSKIVKTESYITTDGKSFTSKEKAEAYQHNLDFERVYIHDEYDTLQQAVNSFKSYLDKYGDCKLNYFYEDSPYIEVRKEQTKQ